MITKCFCCGITPVRDVDGQIQLTNLCWLCLSCGATADKQCEYHQPKRMRLYIKKQRAKSGYNKFLAKIK